MSLPTREEMLEAIKRIALTPDGKLLRRYCQIEVNRVLPPSELSGGALPWSEGRRNFAREIASIMDVELAKAATLDHTGDPDAPVTQPPAQPIAGRKRIGRRVAPYRDDAA